MTMNKVIVRAWTDPAYKSKLIDSPHDALAEMGMNVPEGTKVTVLQNTAQNTHVVLPVPPANLNEITMDELEAVAGGTATQTNCTLTFPDC